MLYETDSNSNSEYKYEKKIINSITIRHLFYRHSTQRLHKAINSAKAAQKHKSLKRIVANEYGQKITYNAFRARWVKAKDQAIQLNEDMKFDFTFHDIKAKGISDWDGDKKRFSGHKSDSQVAVYDRKTEIVESHK